MAKEEKEQEIIFGGRSYGKKTIGDLVQHCELLRVDNKGLAKEILSLKRQLGGYRTSNENYRKQVSTLKERIEHYKSLDIEGDEMYEKKIAQCEALEKQLGNEIKKNAQLQASILNITDENVRIKQENADLQAELARKCRPWWRKIF